MAAKKPAPFGGKKAAPFAPGGDRNTASPKKADGTKRVSPSSPSKKH